MPMSYRSFRRMSQLRPVHSIKHVVDQQLGLVAAAQQTFDLVSTVDAPVLANTNQVETGARVNAIFLKVECAATTSGALSNIYMIIMKNPGNNLTVPAPNTIGSRDEKKFVIHQEMTMTERSTAGNPRVLFKGVISIPRNYRRFGPVDSLKIAFLSPGTNQDVCFQCIYKEYR